MSFAERFEELEIWQQARALNKSIYALLKDCGDYSFRDQMRRASLSVMNNISEGFERRTKKDFAHFLDLAKGSAGEVRSMTFAAEDVGILKKSEAEQLRAEYEMLSRRIAGFQRHLRA
ncbi:MAG: four helix bundle protein [Sphaerospermopsis kisseleviana]